MDRRTFLKTSGVATGSVAVAATTLPAPAIAERVKDLKMVMSWPKGFPGLGTGAARFASRLETALDGKYRIKLFGGGELVHPLKCLDALQDGTADLYHSAENFYQDKSKALSFFAAVPFGFRADEMDAWVHNGGGQWLWDEVAGQFGVKPFLCGNTGVQTGCWFRAPVTSLNDFKGLEMRVPGFGGDVVRALGATPVTLAGSEILPALEAGTIDAAESVGPYNDLAFGFHKVTKHMHFPGFHEPGTVLSLGVRRGLWDKMGKDEQTILAAIASSENNLTLAEFNANNSAALDTLVNRHGVQVREFSDEIFKGMSMAAKDVLATAGSTDALTKKVYESFLGFRKIALEGRASPSRPL